MSAATQRSNAIALIEIDGAIAEGMVLTACARCRQVKPARPLKF